MFMYIYIYAYTAVQGMRRFLVQNFTKSLWILILWYPNEQHFIGMIVLLQQRYQFFNLTTVIFYFVNLILQNTILNKPR